MTATQRLRQKRKENNLCQDCGKPLDREGIRCISCNQKMREYSKESRDWYISNRICPICRKNILMQNESACLECKAKETNRKSRVRKTNKDRINENQRKRYHKMRKIREKNNEVCNRCGRPNVDSRYKLCGICRDKGRRMYAKYTKHETRDEQKMRYLRGLCYYCDEPNLTGMKVCQKHYDKICELNRNKPNIEFRKFVI